MPLLSKSRPKYRKHKASGQAVVTLNGRDHYLGKHGSQPSLALYDRLTGEWQLGGRQCLPTEGEAISVAELCFRFLRYARGYYVKNRQPTGTVQSFKATIKYLRLWYAREQATNFGPLALRAIRQRMIDDGLSRRYINDHVSRIKQIFKWGVAEELVPATVHQALTAVQGLRFGRTEARETEPVKAVDDSIVKATLPFLPEVPGDMVQVQRYSGMRPGEVCIMRPCDIDRSGEVWVYRPQSHKTQHHGKDRLIPLGQRAQVLLQKYLDRDPEAYCFQPAESEAKRRAQASAARKTPLSCGNRPGSNRRRRPKRQPGACYVTSAYRRAIARACEKAFPHPTLAATAKSRLEVGEKAEVYRWRKNNRWAPNRLRHTAGTEIRREFGLEAAQIVLGHSSADVTQVYAERNLKLGSDVARAIG
jgi:integrase